MFDLTLFDWRKLTVGRVRSMLPRKTARVLLLDPADRLLLIRMHDPDVGDAEGKVLERACWVTIGGEKEPGENIAAAARRELLEETGLPMSHSARLSGRLSMFFASMAKSG